MDPVSALPSSLFVSNEPAVPEVGDNELGRDAFLSLLTTQLQNQDPSSPMSNEDFIAQLASFTSVEQLMGMRDLLEQQTYGLAALNNSSMANLLGTEVTAMTDQFHYDGEGEATLHYDAATAATGVTVRVMDSVGRVVDTIEIGSIEAGEGTYVWDGRGLDGDRLPEGDYHFEVSGSDSDGNEVYIMEQLVGIVDEMDYTTGTPRPSIGGISVEISDILRLQTGE